jgi:hypothetical protein
VTCALQNFGCDLCLFPTQICLCECKVFELFQHFFLFSHFHSTSFCFKSYLSNHYQVLQESSVGVAGGSDTLTKVCLMLDFQFCLKVDFRKDKTHHHQRVWRRAQLSTVTPNVFRSKHPTRFENKSSGFEMYFCKTYLFFVVQCFSVQSKVLPSHSVSVFSWTRYSMFLRTGRFGKKVALYKCFFQTCTLQKSFSKLALNRKTQ